MRMTTIHQVRDLGHNRCRVTLASMFGNHDLRERELPISADTLIRGIQATDQGVLIQRAFPQLSISDREFLLTGMTDEDWNALD